MKKSLTVGCVIMASGLSRRFGTNKLLADFCGQPMLCRAFDATATPGIAARIVVTRSEEVQALCRAQGVPVLLHSLPGRNDTVRLGLSALLEQLPDKLQETAALRLEYPELSLSELAAEFDPPVSKSCLNHRLRKLLELAKNLDESIQKEGRNDESV